MELTNDENMQHVWVYDWGSETGRQLFVDFIQTAIASGSVDGMFADKWVRSGCVNVGFGDPLNYSYPLLKTASGTQRSSCTSEPPPRRPRSGLADRRSAQSFGDRRNLLETVVQDHRNPVSLIVAR